MPVSDLDEVACALRACTICKDAPRYGPPLPHEPRPIIQADAAARLCIAGQAPGTRVHASGKPFTDPSGTRLRAWMGIGEDVFYNPAQLAIVPMGHCFPGLDAKGGDLPPRRECAETWRARVFEKLPAIELILVIGQYAKDWHLPEQRGVSLTETVRGWRAIFEGSRLPRCLPLPHPSWRNTGWLKANPWFDEEVLPVLRAEVARLTSPDGMAIAPAAP
jgi:uracil-DNA glycosylase